MNSTEIDQRIIAAFKQWPDAVDQWEERHQTCIPRTEENKVLARLAFVAGLELAIEVIGAEPELPGPMPRAYEELSREELCRRAVQATKRLTATTIRDAAAITLKL